ncbi:MULTISPECIES: hypothetical protein [unclassified Pseudomonas]|uniref:hypothetical protein n=1 Tax=unclassified Pseudomonas TaxID=196821 RepID=UPI00244979DA|nr:hypothetical protein [Pseudomonas sp. GD03944]MDH1265741.1 hypothetical protein [Pseudomonas sp. GD03944]
MNTHPFNRQIAAKGLLTGVALVMGLGLLGESRSEKVEAGVQQVKPITLPVAPTIQQVGNATIQPATQTFQPRNTGRWVF